jgi:hypothetical protein
VLLWEKIINWINKSQEKFMFKKGEKDEIWVFDDFTVEYEVRGIGEMGRE